MTYENNHSLVLINLRSRLIEVRIQLRWIPTGDLILYSVFVKFLLRRVSKKIEKMRKRGKQSLIRVFLSRYKISPTESAKGSKQLVKVSTCSRQLMEQKKK